MDFAHNQLAFGRKLIVLLLDAYSRKAHVNDGRLYCGSEDVVATKEADCG